MRLWLPLALLAAGVGGAPLPRDAHDPLTPLLREIDEDLASIELMNEHAAEHTRLESLTPTTERAAARPEHPVQPRHSLPRLERERRRGWLAKAWNYMKSKLPKFKNPLRARESIEGLANDKFYWADPELDFDGWDAMYAKNKATWDTAIQGAVTVGRARLAATELVVDEDRTEAVVLKLLASGDDISYLKQEVRTACHAAAGTAIPLAVARAHGSESRAPPQAIVHEHLLIAPAAYEAGGETLDTTGASNVAHAYGAGVCTVVDPTTQEQNDHVRPQPRAVPPMPRAHGRTWRDRRRCWSSRGGIGMQKPRWVLLTPMKTRGRARPWISSSAR